MVDMGRLDGIRFEEELAEVAGATTDDVADRNVITGRITRCGQPAAGVRVQAIGILTIGIEIDAKPCRKSTSTRALGSATTSADGTYSISYTPSPADAGFCAYSARVRVTVLEGGGTVWQSPELGERRSVRIDRELYPDCSGGESAVLVIDGTGRPVANAEVFHNGRLVGRTNTQGNVSIESLEIGDRLVARRLRYEHRTDRNGHSEGSTANWSHRSYNTSLRVFYDSNGDNVELRQFVVADPATIQRLQVTTFNTLIGFNLLVSLEWDATADEIRRYTDRILEMSELLYNCTDGQLLVERVSVVDNRRYWDDADIRIYANLNQRSQADVGAIFSAGGRIHMNPNDAHEPSVTLHELGHYAFNVYDEYKAGSGWEEGDGPPICTFASESDGTDFSAGGSKDSCLMRGARNAEIKKMCSTNPANPHATTTRQGVKDCWSEILEGYGNRYWRLRTPAGEGAIVDVFPDSGVPLATTTTPPAGVGTVASYIPIEDWKPILRTSSVVRVDECPDRLVRVELDGSPRDDVRISLESGSVTTYQGVTKEYDLAYDVSSGPGEIRIRGAHVGDRVTAFAWVDGSGLFPDMLVGSVDVDNCGTGALVLALRRIDLPFLIRLEPIGPGETRVLVDAAGPATRPAIARVRVGGTDPISIALPSAARAADASVRGRLTGLPERDIVDLETGFVDDEGRETVVRTTSSFASLREDDALDVASADGRLELSLPARALQAPAGIVIETAVGVPPPPDRLAIVGDAYRITSSRGDPLALDSALDFNLDVDANGRPRDRTELLDPTIVRLTDDGRSWDDVHVHQRSNRFVCARIARLGTYALAALAKHDEPDHR
jgi:hypothetical protein